MEDFSKNLPKIEWISKAWTLNIPLVNTSVNIVYKMPYGYEIPEWNCTKNTSCYVTKMSLSDIYVDKTKIMRIEKHKMPCFVKYWDKKMPWIYLNMFSIKIIKSMQFIWADARIKLKFGECSASIACYPATRFDSGWSWEQPPFWLLRVWKVFPNTCWICSKHFPIISDLL